MTLRNLFNTVARGAWCVACAASLHAQTKNAPPTTHHGVDPIKDNSFLIEEAYNQDAGVVQHIYTFSRPLTGRDWAFTFTQEWPVHGMKHQVSYTVPMFHSGTGLLADEGVGDIAAHYRYQFYGLNGGPLYIAPRITLMLGTGDPARSRGAGGMSLQANLPVSAEISESFTVHVNGGFTFTPRAENSLLDRARAMSSNAGASVIWMPRRTLNVLLESTWADVASVISNGVTVSERQTMIAPGVRWAYNLPSGMQIVPGLAYVVGPTRANRALFVYLSIEHPFSRQSATEQKND